MVLGSGGGWCHASSTAGMAGAITCADCLPLIKGFGRPWYLTLQVGFPQRSRGPLSPPGRRSEMPLSPPPLRTQSLAGKDLLFICSLSIQSVGPLRSPFVVCLLRALSARESALARPGLVFPIVNALSVGRVPSRQIA